MGLLRQWRDEERWLRKQPARLSARGWAAVAAWMATVEPVDAPVRLQAAQRGVLRELDRLAETALPELGAALAEVDAPLPDD